MSRSYTATSLAALMALSMPVAAHAATATADNTASAILEITSTGAFTFDFTEIEAEPEIAATGGGVGGATSEVLANGFVDLTTEATAQAGPQVSSAFGLSESGVEILVSSASEAPQRVTFTLDWLIEGQGGITDPATDSASSLGTVGFGEGASGSNLLSESVAVTGTDGGAEGSLGDTFTYSFNLDGLEAATFNMSTSSQAEANVIPLPAGLPLLLAGLGALALLRRARRG